MRPVLYICNEEGIPVALRERNRHEVLRWGEFMEKSENKIVKRSRGSNGRVVSTVFLGVDYAFQGPPVVWETMVFHEKPEAEDQSWMDLDCDRCAGNREQAEAMHEKMCRKHNVPVESENK